MLSSFHSWITTHALPTWADRGFDDATNLFHERLSRHGEPVRVPYRAMVQARQIYVFSHAASLGLLSDGHDRADRAMRRLRRSFARTSGGMTSFIYSIDPVGGDHRSTAIDAYTQAFVLFAASHLYRQTGDATLIALVEEVVRFIERRLADRALGGFVDALPVPPNAAKRQNPHMHLLEAYLSLEEAMPGCGHLERAASLVRLFRERLFMSANGVLLEHFAADWGPHPDSERAIVVEPGHHYEWIWLLEWFRRLSGEDLADERQALWRTAQAHGHAANGLIYDELADGGYAASGGHRLWPHTEGIKAAAALHGHGAGTIAFADRMAGLLLESFLGRPFAGGWIDHLNPDLTPRVEYVPASSLYHLFLASAQARTVFGAGIDAARVV